MGMFSTTFIVNGQSTQRKGLKPMRTAPKDTTAIIDATETVGTADTITAPGKINQILKLSDFKKPANSRVESLMITNLSASDTITSIILDIDYRTARGKQLHRRQVTFTIVVPPGETRHVDTQSWDKQGIFYHKSIPPARPSQRTRPFNVTLKPLQLIILKRRD